MDPKESRGRILIAEDDAGLAALVRESLSERGYAAVSTGSVAEAKRLLDLRHFDLAVLDLKLADGSGDDICRHIRGGTRHGDMPVIMLTGAAGAEDMARGVEAGADYYLTKPMPASELLLWVRALLKRVTGDWDRGTTIGVPGLRINPDVRTVWCDDEIVRGLAPREFDVLWALAQAHPKQLSHRELLQEVWGEAPPSNTLRVHIQRLRSKLGFKGGSHIVTLPDAYRLE